MKIPFLIIIAFIIFGCKKKDALPGTRLLKEVYTVAGGSHDTTSYTYDNNGRLVQINYSPSSFSTYTRDASGLLISMYIVNPGGAGGSIINHDASTLHYTSIVRSSVNDTVAIFYSGDRISEAKEYVNFTGSWIPWVTHRYSYDAKGNLIYYEETSYSSGTPFTVSFTFDFDTHINPVPVSIEDAIIMQLIEHTGPNNVLHKRYDINGSNSFNTTNVYTYNANDMPATRNETRSNSNGTVTTATAEYIY